MVFECWIIVIRINRINTEVESLKNSWNVGIKIQSITMCT
jgi:hypothetical protein